MNDTETVADFTPEGCGCRDDEDGAPPRPQVVVSMGAGVSVGELYEWAGDNEKVTVNGFPASVGAAGGYVLGGGLGESSFSGRLHLANRAANNRSSGIEARDGR